jgi:hypothetical protein
MSEKEENSNLTEIEKRLTDRKTYSVINLVAYILLLISTCVIGLNLTKGVFSKDTKNNINYYATIGLVMTWIILIIAESVKLHKVY